MSELHFEKTEHNFGETFRESKDNRSETSPVGKNTNGGSSKKLNIKALVISLSIIWGIAFLLTGIANLIWPDYAHPFLQVLASVYPGYTADGSLSDLLIGTIYALSDAALGALVLGWVYNYFDRIFISHGT